MEQLKVTQKGLSDLRINFFTEHVKESAKRLSALPIGARVLAYGWLEEELHRPRLDPLIVKGLLVGLLYGLDLLFSLEVTPRQYELLIKEAEHLYRTLLAISLSLRGRLVIQRTERGWVLKEVE